MGDADLNMHSLAGFAYWRDLAWEHQRSVLASRALSLHDLAKLAPLGKVFKEVHRERRAQDEEWNENAAVTVLGTHAIDTLVRWVSCPNLGPQSSGHYPLMRQLKLSEGEPWPTLTLSPRSQFI
jgi:hypothetical protein